MAKHVHDNNIAAYQQARAHLENQAGITDDQIDRLLNDQPSIIGNNKLLAQYFKSARVGLEALTTYPFDNPTRSLSGEIPNPAAYDYEQYFAPRDTSGGEAYANVVPAEDLANPQALVQNGVLPPEVGQALETLYQRGSLFADGQAPKLSQEEGFRAPTSPAGVGARNAMHGSGSQPTTPIYGPGGIPSGGSSDGQFISSGDSATDQWLSYLGGIDAAATGTYEQMMQQLLGHRQMEQHLNHLISGLDPTNPDDAHQIQVLMHEMQFVRDSKRELFDGIQRLTEVRRQQTELVKGILDIFNRVNSQIASNFRQ